jgi:hypothetical protein
MGSVVLLPRRPAGLLAVHGSPLDPVPSLPPRAYGTYVTGTLAGARGGHPQVALTR